VIQIQHHAGIWRLDILCPEEGHGGQIWRHALVFVLDNFMTDDIAVYDPVIVGRTKGDELYKQGSLAFFPSSKSMVWPGS